MVRFALVKGVVLLLLMLLGAWLVLWGIYYGIAVERYKRGPQAEGVILESEIRYGGNDFWLEVLYEYPVSGTTYRANRISIQHEYAESRHIAETRQERYSVGARVLVSYDPRDPSRAVLEHGDHEATIFFTLFGAILVLFPGAFLVIGGAAQYGNQILAFIFVPRLKKAHAEMQQAAAELQAIDQKLGQTALAHADAVAARIDAIELGE